MPKQTHGVSLTITVDSLEAECLEILAAQWEVKRARIAAHAVSAFIRDSVKAGRVMGMDLAYGASLTVFAGPNKDDATRRLMWKVLDIIQKGDTSRALHLLRKHFPDSYVRERRQVPEMFHVQDPLGGNGLAPEADLRGDPEPPIVDLST